MGHDINVAYFWFHKSIVNFISSGILITRHVGVIPGVEVSVWSIMNCTDISLCRWGQSRGEMGDGFTALVVFFKNVYNLKVEVFIGCIYPIMLAQLLPSSCSLRRRLPCSRPCPSPRPSRQTLWVCWQGEAHQSWPPASGGSPGDGIWNRRVFL